MSTSHLLDIPTLTGKTTTSKKRCQCVFRADDFATKPDVPKRVSPDGLKAIEILELTVRMNGCRFEAGLLGRSNQTRLVDNRDAAARCLFALGFKADTELTQQYEEGINEYIRLSQGR